MFDKVKLALKAKKVQDELKRTEIEATSAEGKIIVIFTGDLKLKSITIDESLLSPDNKAQLEKLLRETVGQALQKTQSHTAEKTREVMKELGVDIPGL